MFGSLAKCNYGMKSVCKQSVRHYRNIVKVFSDRGLLQDVFPKEQVSNLVKLMEKKQVGIYAGKFYLLLKDFGFILSHNLN